MLYKVLQDHWLTFLSELECTAEPPFLPAFVMTEAEAFLRCGIFAHGLILAKCRECGWCSPVAFSCQRSLPELHRPTNVRFRRALGRQGDAARPRTTVGADCAAANLFFIPSGLLPMTTWRKSPPPYSAASNASCPTVSLPRGSGDSSKAPFLVAMAEASARGVIATGPRAGCRIVRVRGPTAEVDAFVLGGCVHKSKVSTCKRPLGSGRTIETVSNGWAATCLVRLSRRIACPDSMTSVSSCGSSGPGGMAPRRSSSRRTS